MERLEEKFYSASFITSSRESYAYYLRYPRSTFAAMDDGAVVGFINMFPVVDRVFLGLINGTYQDSALTYQDIQSIDSTPYSPLHMFLSCIVVDGPYRKRGVTHALLGAATQAYAHVERRCDFIVTDNVTDAGCRFSLRLGFDFICKSNHDSTLFASPYERFVNRVASLHAGDGSSLLVPPQKLPL